MQRSDRVVQARSETTANDGAVRASDLIRAQRAPAAPWTVFVDTISEPRRRAPRDSLVRRRPTEWDVVDDKSENNKENIGYDVRRPKRARRSLQVIQDCDDGDDDTTTTPVRRATQLPASTPTPSPKSNGKRKLQTPTPPQEKVATKPKAKPASEPEVRAEQVTPPPPTTPARTRRPLEDITHLFIDPTAHYFQPWRRAARVATMRMSSMRVL